MGRSYEPRGEQLLQHAVQRLEVRGSWPAVAGASSRSTQARRSGRGTASKACWQLVSSGRQASSCWAHGPRGGTAPRQQAVGSQPSTWGAGPRVKVAAQHSNSKKACYLVMLASNLFIAFACLVSLSQLVLDLPNCFQIFHA